MIRELVVVGIVGAPIVLWFAASSVLWAATGRKGTRRCGDRVVAPTQAYRIAAIKGLGAVAFCACVAVHFMGAPFVWLVAAPLAVIWATYLAERAWYRSFPPMPGRGLPPEGPGSREGGA